MSEDRAERLQAIAQEIQGCTACRLYQRTTHAVPGYGNVHAEIMFIGEAPGAEEDRQGLPFVGRSGQYLDYLLNLIGLRREQVFITNVVKHRPPDNRDPAPDEIHACKAFLDRQFEIIDPLVVATLGRFSMARYFPNGKISVIHGKPKYADNRAYYPLFHPAAVLRNPDLRRDMEADIRRLLDVIAEVKKRRAAGMQPPAPPPEEEEAPPKQLRLF